MLKWLWMIIKEKTDLDASSEFVKVVVDIAYDRLAAYCDLHIDCAEELSATGSAYENLWGANVFPKNGAIAFTSVINIRPKVNNRSLEIQNPDVRKRVEEIIRRFFIFP